MVLTLDIHQNFQFGLFCLTNHHSKTNRLLQNSPFFIITLYYKHFIFELRLYTENILLINRIHIFSERHTLSPEALHLYIHKNMLLTC